MDQAQRELTEFVIKRAFEPVMHAKTDGRSEADRRALEHVQKATRSEIERYRRYGSARELATNFRRDLSSDAARKMHAELHRLHLPTIEDIRDEFEDRPARSASAPRPDPRTAFGPSSAERPLRAGTDKRRAEAEGGVIVQAPRRRTEDGMTDDPHLRGPQDRSRISMREEHEVRYWTAKLGVSKQQLQSAVDKVGHSVVKVRNELGLPPVDEGAE